MMMTQVQQKGGDCVGQQFYGAYTFFLKKTS